MSMAFTSVVLRAVTIALLIAITGCHQQGGATTLTRAAGANEPLELSAALFEAPKTGDEVRKGEYGRVYDRKTPTGTRPVFAWVWWMARGEGAGVTLPVTPGKVHVRGDPSRVRVIGGITLEITGQGMPDASVPNNGWVYVIGDGACAGGRCVSGQADGSRIIAETQRVGNTRTERIVVLETPPGHTVAIYDIRSYTMNGARPTITSVVVPAGSYYEKAFTDDGATTPPELPGATPYTLESFLSLPSDHPVNQLIAEVEQYRIAQHMP